METTEGLKPPTSRFEGGCSIQLNYVAVIGCPPWIRTTISTFRESRPTLRRESNKLAVVVGVAPTLIWRHASV
jgi:hypothetical protein